MFQNYKTYIVASLLVVYAVSGFLTGNLDMNQAVEVGGLGALAATLRNAIANLTA